MAEMKDAHIVEIPVDEEHQQKLICAMNTITAIQNHPLAEISNCPGHLLLLKLWQREENLFGRRIALKESRMVSIKREIFHLCCFFLVFHGIFLTILFTSSVDSKEHTCKNWWIPSLASVCTSLVFVSLVQVKICSYWKVSRQLQREKNNDRALTKCIQELRMKGASFDLSKEPVSGKRMKSSSVEIKWKPFTWWKPASLWISPNQRLSMKFNLQQQRICWFSSLINYLKISCAPFIQVLAVLEFERLDNGIA
ncbi:hypothetical protein H0E87_021331 [Populus deltoides]|uniref:Uncharacterized protein n=1 Tax=Populus deltoides TaxID=3696 RepID=A0A8T2XPY2_POPDE|nr:hypothetical protein H0E87_021331 [Populus deltoides]